MTRLGWSWRTKKPWMGPLSSGPSSLNSMQGGRVSPINWLLLGFIHIIASAGHGVHGSSPLPLVMRSSSMLAALATFVQPVIGQFRSYVAFLQKHDHSCNLSPPTIYGDREELAHWGMWAGMRMGSLTSASTAISARNPARLQPSWRAKSNLRLLIPL